MSKKVALLTMDNLEKSVLDGEKPLFDALRKNGFDAEWVVWNTETAWDDYDLAIIRTTWDYQSKYGEFLECLEGIGRSKCQLFNPLEVVKWNSDKNYLFELEERNLNIVPTKKLEQVSLKESFDYFNVDEVIVKPTVSASAHDTYLISKGRANEYEEILSEVRNRKELIIQPMIKAINSEGEFSVHYFGGSFSHVVLKTPKKGDFRSQEEYGSHIREVALEDKLRKYCEKLIKYLPSSESILYARIDVVRSEDDKFMLMEVELIEPCLYLEFSQGPANMFVEQLKRLVF